MPSYFESRRGKRRETMVAGAFLVLALVLFLMPEDYQQPIRRTIRTVTLTPFIGFQSTLAAQDVRPVDVAALRAQRDSLAAVVAAQAPIVEENRRLRALLGLSERAAAQFASAQLVRVGMLGGESTFLLNVGRRDGLVPGSPVVGGGGLLGVVREVEERTAQGIDWTHPDFRASAMTSDGSAYGIVEPRPGRFREEDLLTLTGAPFHSDIAPGTRIVTSGRGGVYPRGIPIGVVLGIDEADTGWRKNYVLRPLVRPESVTHVLVGAGGGQGGEDLSALWFGAAPPDTGAASGPQPDDEADPSQESP